MPWGAEEYRMKHNKKLSHKAAGAAANQASAMIAHSVPEGKAIATANKHAGKGFGAVPKRKGGGK